MVIAVASVEQDLYWIFDLLFSVSCGVLIVGQLTIIWKYHKKTDNTMPYLAVHNLYLQHTTHLNIVEKAEQLNQKRRTSFTYGKDYNTSSDYWLNNTWKASHHNQAVVFSKC